MINNTIVEFIQARLDEDEEIAKKNIGDGPDNGLGDGEEHGPTWPDYLTYNSEAVERADDFIDRFRPLRQLREIESKRAIVAAHMSACTADRFPESFAYLDGYTTATDLVLRSFAAAWSDHPEYQKEWAS